MPEISKYCSACGNGLVATAVICPECGSPTNQRIVGLGSSSKNKSVAVWLSVLFSYWSWLYTFKENSRKFIVGLIVGLISTALFIVGQVIFTRLATEWSNCWYNQTMNFDGENVELCDSMYNYSAYSWMIWTGFLVSAGIWIWAISDNARKPRAYFESYGA